jgi:inorganic phosphate transporter, PiT family
MSLAVALLLFLALAALAYANGANDVSKGVATLVGSGSSRYRQALIWGTAWTAAGSLAAGIFSRALTATFSKDIIGPDHVTSDTFPLAVLTGATIWVLLATRTGLPVSTTHAITGALCGAAVVAFCGRRSSKRFFFRSCSVRWCRSAGFGFYFPSCGRLSHRLTANARARRRGFQ